MKYSIFIPVFFLSLLFSVSSETKTVHFSVGFTEPKDPDKVSTDIWKEVTPCLHGSFGSIDKRYSRSVPPNINISKKWDATAWKGERTNLQLVVWTSKNIQNVQVISTMLKGKANNIIDSTNIHINIVRYVITDEFLGGYGYRDPDTIPAHLVADPFQNTNSFGLIANSTRPIWITIDVPADAVPDQYQGVIIVNTSKKQILEFEINLLVQDMLLPPPVDWAYHLDLWLNPFAVARYHNVEIWSPKFYSILKPYVKMLAGAGQKCIMAIIIDEPWAALPVYDEYKSMVKKIKKTNGDWEYDYSVFDQYVQFIQECGITEQINCYTMGTWGDKYLYFDENSAGYKTIKTIPGSEDYNSFWEPFLIDFSSHLKKMRWINKTTIAMDERSLYQMKSIISLVKKCAPELKVAVAINRFNPELNFDIYDISSIAHYPLKKELIRERLDRGLPTTFYTCCAPPEHPNNFTFSPPADATWLGWYAAAQGYSGFLRYAFNSWVKDPLMDSRYRTWPAGDCFQIYPGPRSSIRFERLREGIQDYEKIRILRRKYLEMNSIEGNTRIKELDDFLKSFTLESLHIKSSEQWINDGKSILNRISD